MGTPRGEKKKGWNPTGWWRDLAWRWKVTGMGLVIGIISCGLWTVPAGWLAFQGGYTSHGVVYTLASIAAMAVATCGGYLMGKRMERELDCNC